MDKAGEFFLNKYSSYNEIKRIVVIVENGGSVRSDGENIVKEKRQEELDKQALIDKQNAIIAEKERLRLEQEGVKLQGRYDKMKQNLFADPETGNSYSQ
jgi:phage terminase small subunit